MVIDRKLTVGQWEVRVDMTWVRAESRAAANGVNF